MDVGHVMMIFNRMKSNLVGRTLKDSAFLSSARHPDEIHPPALALRGTHNNFFEAEV